MNTPKRNILFLLIFLLLFAGSSIYLFKDKINRLFFEPNVPSAGGSVSFEEGASVKDNKPIEIIAENLKIPWEVAFLPDKDVLVTERPGTILRVGTDRKIYHIEGVESSGERGLMGLVLHPNFEQNKLIYLYFTTDTNGTLRNKIERYRLEKDNLYDKTVIIDNIPGSIYHDGGRIEFGPDGMLYITTGDAGQPHLAQNKNSLAGKILRIEDDGSIPEDNPYKNAVWTYGHRNSQGLVWDNQGRLWATEHGRSGAQSGLDELNLIEKGKNYGWPTIQGDETRTEMETPVINSGPNYTWAPADIEFINGSLFFSGLRGEALYEAKINDLVTPERISSAPEIKIHFLKEFGRLRATRLSPDGYLYITTSNTDGRGEPKSGDDKLIRIDPEIFANR